jgi:hypothetical protein
MKEAVALMESSEVTSSWRGVTVPRIPGVDLYEGGVSGIA